MAMPAVPVPRAVSRWSGRVLLLADEVRQLPPRATTLLAWLEAIAVEVQDLVAQSAATRAAAAALIARMEATRAHVDEVVLRADLTRAAAEVTVGEVAELTARARHLLDELEPSLHRVEPMLRRMARASDPQVVDTMLGLVERLPRLVDRAEAEVFPVMETLRSVAPDVADLLSVASQLDEMLGRVPGMGRIKRKVEEQQG